MRAEYYSYDQIMVDEMGGACGMYGEKVTAYRVSVGKNEGKRPLGRTTYRWENIIEIFLSK